jgi:hypothetical protein
MALEQQNMMWLAFWTVGGLLVVGFNAIGAVAVRRVARKHGIGFIQALRLREALGSQEVLGVNVDRLRITWVVVLLTLWLVAFAIIDRT